MSEIWKDIVNYEGLYQVSNLGNVRSLSFGARNIRKSNKIKLLKQSPTNCGYLKVQLYKNGYKMFYVHRLVAIAFLPNPENKKQINHIDGNKQNNNVLNLEWSSASDNQKHAIRHGLRTPSPMIGRKGGLHPTSRPILQFDKNGTFIKRWCSISEATEYYNFGRSDIWRCLSGNRKTAKGYIWKYDS